MIEQPVTVNTPGEIDDVVVVLDSNSLWSAFAGSGTVAFKTLSALGEKRAIRIYISEIVLREITSQMKGKVRKAQQELNDSLEALCRLTTSDHKGKLHEAKASLELISAKTEHEACGRIQEWIKRANVSILPVSDDHASRVLEAYFEGNAPFKDAKNRNDIPDGFIWEALIDLIQRGHVDVQFVCNDGGVHTHAAKLEQITTHKDISSLLKSGDLPIVTDEEDFELAKHFRTDAVRVEEIAKGVIQRSISDVDLPIPAGIAPVSTAGAFVIEKILALKELKLDPDSVIPLGNRTVSIAFACSATIRASYESESVRQEGVFDILETGRVRGDYEVKARIVLLVNSQRGADDITGSSEIEIEDIQIGFCTATPAKLSDADDGGVAISFDRSGMEYALKARRGFVFIAGRLKNKRFRAGSVLLNDVAVHHPDGLYLATHGSLVGTSIQSVILLDRRGFEDSDVFIEKVLSLGPDAITLQIHNEDDLDEAYRLEDQGEMLIIGVTGAKNEKELAALTDSFSPQFLTVIAK